MQLEGCANKCHLPISLKFTSTKNGPITQISTWTGSQANDGVGVAVKHLLDEQLLDLLVVLVDGHHGARAAGQDEPRVRTDAGQDLQWQEEAG